MTVIYVETAANSREVQWLIQSAIEAEVSRLKLALEAARTRLAIFENKYDVSSEQFISEMAAEDLEGKDDEYIQWAGEYHLMESMGERLKQLQGVEFGDPNLLRAD